MSIGPLQIFLIILLVVLLFGTKKLGNVGSDLGKAIRGFKKGLNDNDDDDEVAEQDKPEPQLKADDAKPAEDSKASEQARERDN